ncbi:unnamed protein product [Fusarium graminearum]|uniref:Uncharacterized protein n=1 Tax=Gibberella zeae TaxID=5518 RepID=A0A4E9EIX1_GIBZA|nr:unnamed protein product [Fusarium graminearum]CAG1989704.1 unnamed protein product [Fusarium graminearum]
MFQALSDLPRSWSGDPSLSSQEYFQKAVEGSGLQERSPELIDAGVNDRPGQQERVQSASASLQSGSPVVGWTNC